MGSHETRFVIHAVLEAFGCQNRFKKVLGLNEELVNRVVNKKRTQIIADGGTEDAVGLIQNSRLESQTQIQLNKKTILSNNYNKTKYIYLF